MIWTSPLIAVPCVLIVMFGALFLLERIQRRMTVAMLREVAADLEREFAANKDATP